MSDMKPESQAQVSANMRDTIAALRAEVAALKHYQELDGLAMRLANNELAKRRREIAALKAECAEAWRVHSEVVAELKAKLAKYTEPLTDEHLAVLSMSVRGYTSWQEKDAAIRRVSGGEVMLGFNLENEYHNLRVQYDQLFDQCSASIAENVELRRQLAAANERAGKYKSALRSLVNEVRASAGAFEDKVREAVGNTNYACLMDKVEQARKALEVPDAL